MSEISVKSLNVEIIEKWTTLTEIFNEINNLCNSKSGKFDTVVSEDYKDLQRLTKNFVKQLRSIDKWIVIEIDNYKNMNVNSLNLLDSFANSLILLIDAICKKGFCSRVPKPSEKANQEICEDMKIVFETRQKKIKTLYKLASISRVGRDKGKTVKKSLVGEEKIGGKRKRQTKTRR